MKNITMFKGSAKTGFTKFQVYVHKYFKNAGNNKRKEVITLMLDFAHTKDSKKASNGKIVGNFSEGKISTIRLGISQGDITDLANLLAFLKHEKQTFSTVHESNSGGGKKSISAFTGEQDVKIFVPGKGEEIVKEKTKVITISNNGEKISFTLTLPEAKLIASWIEKYYI